MAAALNFDDLVPGGSAPPLTVRPAPAAQPKASLSFDDLVPAQQAAPSGVGSTIWNALKSVPQAADDDVRLLVNGMTLGGADKLASWITGDPKGQAAMTQAAADRAGSAGTAAGILGTLLPAGAAGRAIGGAAAAAEGVPLAGRVLASPFTQAAGAGAAVGAGDALGHDQSPAQGAALGSLFGLGGQAVGSAAGAGLRGLGGLFADAPAIPTSDALRQSARDAYQAADQAGIVYSPDATARLSNAIRGQMADFGYHPALQPGGAAVLDLLDRAGGQNATLAGIDTIRRAAGQMGSPAYPSAGELGRNIRGVIDDFTANPRPGDVLMGDQAGGLDALTQARQLWQRSSKDADLSDALTAAANRAGSVGSGGNINNATRQQVRGVLEGRNDWTPDERDALTAIVRGTPVGNTLRQVGKLSPEGNGLMAALDIGMGIHDPRTLGLTTAGFVAKRAADAVTGNAVNRAGQLIRAGGDASALQVPPNWMQRAGGAVADPIALLALGAGARMPQTGGVPAQ